MARRALACISFTLFACSNHAVGGPGCPDGRPRSSDGLCLAAGADGGRAGDSAEHDATLTPSRCTPVGLGNVVLSEALVDPAGADTTAAEFVELAGVPGTRLDGVVVVGRDDDADREWLRLALDGHRLDDDGRLLLGASGTAYSAGNLPTGLQNGPDRLVLIDCDATTELDALAWPRSGGSNGDSWHRCDSGAVVAAPPSPGTGGEPPACTAAGDAGSADAGPATDVGDHPDAADDVSGAQDGAASGDVWPDLLDATEVGGPTPDVTDVPQICEPAAGLVQIHEIYFDAVGPDDGHEFVELHGVPDTRLDGVTLVGINGRDGTAFWGPQALGGQIGPGALVVVGQAGVVERDAAMAGAIQNGPDSIVLRDCDGAIIDAVAWGTFSAGEVAAGEGPAAVVPAPGQSLSRDSGADTDNNAADFAPSTPTPGELARHEGSVDSSLP